ncbi:hypothetical protein EYF80_044155 [Liparis tanakae]|uniref:Uncharacterized protein n=1 Tax=Liparis tanakae TaxID=230148 RepID=A0A4Z2FXN4_9TELE|nr:hypothetical protein EYF80_044155 [Liparis tanakae]
MTLRRRLLPRPAGSAAVPLPVVHRGAFLGDALQRRLSTPRTVDGRKGLRPPGLWSAVSRELRILETLTYIGDESGDLA